MYDGTHAVSVIREQHIGLKHYTSLQLLCTADLAYKQLRMWIASHHAMQGKVTVICNLTNREHGRIESFPEGMILISKLADNAPVMTRGGDTYPGLRQELEKCCPGCRGHRLNARI